MKLNFHDKYVKQIKRCKMQRNISGVVYTRQSDQPMKFSEKLDALQRKVSYYS